IIQIISRGIRLYKDKILDILIPILEEEESFDSMRDIILALDKEDNKFIQMVYSNSKKLKLRELNFNLNNGYRNWSTHHNTFQIDETELFNMRENFSKWKMRV